MGLCLCAVLISSAECGDLVRETVDTISSLSWLRMTERIAHWTVDRYKHQSAILDISNKSQPLKYNESHIQPRPTGLEWFLDRFI